MLATGSSEGETLEKVFVTTFWLVVLGVIVAGAWWAVRSGALEYVAIAIQWVGGILGAFGFFMAIGSAPMGYKGGGGPEASLVPATFLALLGGVIWACGGVLQAGEGLGWFLAFPVLFVAGVAAFFSWIALMKS